MKTRFAVTFDIEPKLRFTEATYPNLNITPNYEDGKLTALQVDVEVTLGDIVDVEEIAKEQAREKAIRTVTPLIERLRYLSGEHVEYQIKKMYQTSPPGVRWSQLDAISVSCLVKGAEPPFPFAMPKEDSLLSQHPDTPDQLMHYNMGTKADNVAEKITKFYMVVEKEEGSRRKRDDLTNIRDALSHPELKNQQVRDFLRENIGSDSIDFNNKAHLRFLNVMRQKVQQKAKEILDRKIQ